MCLKVALGSASFYEDRGSFSEEDIQTYKQDLHFFIHLRRTLSESPDRMPAFEQIGMDQAKEVIEVVPKKRKLFTNAADLPLRG